MIVWNMTVIISFPRMIQYAHGACSEGMRATNIPLRLTVKRESSRTVEVSTLQRWRVVLSQEPGCIILLLTFKEPLDGRNFGGQITQAFCC